MYFINIFDFDCGFSYWILWICLYTGFYPPFVQFCSRGVCSFERAIFSSEPILLTAIFRTSLCHHFGTCIIIQSDRYIPFHVFCSSFSRTQLYFVQCLSMLFFNSFSPHFCDLSRPFSSMFQKQSKNQEIWSKRKKRRKFGRAKFKKPIQNNHWKPKTAEIFQYDGHEIVPGKSLKVNVSVANTRLFLGNIPKSKTKDEILEEIKKHAGNKNRNFLIENYARRKKTGKFAAKSPRTFQKFSRVLRQGTVKMEIVCRGRRGCDSLRHPRCDWSPQEQGLLLRRLRRPQDRLRRQAQDPAAQGKRRMKVTEGKRRKCLHFSFQRGQKLWSQIL